MLGLSCGTQAFHRGAGTQLLSGCGSRALHRGAGARLLSGCGARALHPGAGAQLLSGCGARAWCLRCVGSLVVIYGLQSVG